MVRRRVDLRRIEDKGKRTASFSKRRSGLMKKAEELSVLCDAEVAIIVFSPLGKLSCFSSHSSVEATIQRYYEFSDAEQNVRKRAFQKKDRRKGSGCLKSNNEMLEIAQRLSDPTNIEHLNPEGLDSLERELNNGLSQISYIKVCNILLSVKMSVPCSPFSGTKRGAAAMSELNLKFLVICHRL